MTVDNLLLLSIYYIRMLYIYLSEYPLFSLSVA